MSRAAWPGQNVPLGATWDGEGTNFALWASAISSFPKTTNGLVACYIVGIPLFWNTLAGDAFYATMLFGGMALAEWKFPHLREPLTVSMN